MTPTTTKTAMAIIVTMVINSMSTMVFAKPTAPTPYSPSGTVNSELVAFVVSDTSNMTKIQLHVENSNGDVIHNKRYSASKTNREGGLCEITPTQEFSFGQSFIWSVRVKDSSGWSPWSEDWQFNTLEESTNVSTSKTTKISVYQNYSLYQSSSYSQPFGNTVIFDEKGEWDDDEMSFTAITSGFYNISAQAHIDTSANDSLNFVRLFIESIRGSNDIDADSDKASIVHYFEGDQNNVDEFSVTGSKLIYVEAGETIRISASANTSNGRDYEIQDGSESSFITIHQVQ